MIRYYSILFNRVLSDSDPDCARRGGARAPSSAELGSSNDRARSLAELGGRTSQDLAEDDNLEMQHIRVTKDTGLWKLRKILGLHS